MSKHFEKMEATSIPNLLKVISRNMTPDGIGERIPCPTCGGQMYRVNNGDFPITEPIKYSRVAHTERFVCTDCGTYADFTQHYVPEPDQSWLEVFVAVED